MILVRKGMGGTLVGNVHQLLSEAGYAIPQTELVAQVFGDGTFAAVRAFQASHVGPDGQALSDDGVVGPDTFYALQHPGTDDDGAAQDFYVAGWYYHPEDARAEVRPVLDFACSRIGDLEDPDGSNDGPLVRPYTAPDFLGDPWCALFASVAYGRLATGSPFGRLAATWGLYEWAVAHGRVIDPLEAVQPGDVLLLLRGERTDPKHRGHTMLAVSAQAANGRIYTVAGNESNAVRGGMRMRETLSAVVRPVP